MELITAGDVTEIRFVSLLCFTFDSRSLTMLRVVDNIITGHFPSSLLRATTILLDFLRKTLVRPKNRFRENSLENYFTIIFFRLSE